MYRKTANLARVLIDRTIWERIPDEVLGRFFSIFIPIETKSSDYMHSFEYLVSNKNLDKYSAGQMIAVHSLEIHQNDAGEIDWMGLRTNRGLIK